MLQSPGSPFGTPKPGSGRIVLVRTGAAEGHREGLLLGVRDDPLSTLGRVQGSKAAELMMEVKVSITPGIAEEHFALCEESAGPTPCHAT